MLCVNLLLSVSIAFNLSDWMGKREVMHREAERLHEVYRWCVSRTNSPAQMVRVPVDTHPDGSVKTMVLADEAQIFLKESYIWAKGVTLEETDAKKCSTAKVSAKECAVDRNTRSGWLDGPASATHKGMTLEGIDAYLSSAEEYVSIFSNVVMTADADMLQKNGRTNTHVRISADLADFDRGEGIVCLDGRVRYDDGEYQLNADRAYAFLEGTNQLRRIEVMGSVTVTNELRNASCKRAEFDCLTGQLMMYESRFEMDTGTRKKGFNDIFGGKR